MNQPQSSSPSPMPEFDARSAQAPDKRDSSQRPHGLDETAMFARKDLAAKAMDFIPKPSLPEAFGRYAVRSVLGSGAFGVVYLGHDTQLDRPVAIKVLQRAAGVSPDDVERFLQEARRLARLKHPAIVTVYDVGSEGSDVYIVSDFIDGTSLKEWLSTNRPTWQEAARIVAALAEALAHAHAQLTVHRDVKPANILMTRVRQPVLVDFGLGLDDAAIAGSDRGAVMGTPAYMSPEQVAGVAHRIDGRTDIYSLGIVLYELLCGRTPFRAADMFELLRQIRDDEPQPPRQVATDLPRELERVCLKAFAKRQKDRYTTANDFAEDLRRVLAAADTSPSTVVAVPTPPSTDTPAPSRPSMTTSPVAPPVTSPDSVGTGLSATPRSTSSQRRARDAERRQLTVMFCDLAESATLAETLDPEDLHQILRDYQQVCTEVVHRFDGELVQTVGDGLLVCFGYPVAYEDAAQRAIRAGLAMLDDVAALSQRIKKSRGVTLALRVGIHTGLAVAGDLSGGTSKIGEPVSIVGEARNVAIELQTTAEPNSVIISGATLRIVQGFFDCQSLGHCAVKGVTKSVEVHRVLREREVRSRIEIAGAGAGGLTPLVGRDREVGLLLDRWEQVKDQQAQVAMLIGEPGIGKSRLTFVVKQQVQQEHDAGDPRTIIEWRCSSQHQNSSLNPAIEFLERHLRFRRDESADTKLARLEQWLTQAGMPLEETVPLFAALVALPLPARYPALQLTPEKLKQKTLDALSDWLRRCADATPVLFIVEDLHWIDASTLELLRMLIAEAAGDRLFLVLTFRPEFKPPWNDSRLTQVPLQRLNKRQISEMLQQRTSAKALPPEVAEQVAARSDGVPLFIEECTNMLLESGLLKEEAGQYVLTGKLPRDAIPATLQDLLMARLDRLDDAKEVAQLGATLGREFTHELLQAVATIVPPTLDEELGKLLDAELIFKKGRPPQLSYIFKHALIQDAAYNSLLKSKRQQHHQRIAEVLEAQFPETAATTPELLAQHFTEANLPERAVPYWEQAGLLCRDRSANAEAIGHFTRGLQLLDSFDDSPDKDKQELRLQIPLGTAYLSAKGYAAPEGGPIFARARALAERIGEKPQLFAVMWGDWAWHVVRGDFRLCMELAAEAMQLAEQLNDPGITMEALFMPGLTLLYRGDFIGAREHCKHAIAQFDDREQCRLWTAYTGQNSGVTHRCYLALALWHLGYPDQALAMSGEAIAHGREVQHPFSLCYALHHAGWLFQHCRIGLDCEAVGQEEIHIASEHCFALWSVTGTLYRAAGLLQQGRVNDALPELQQGITAYKASGAELALPFYLSLLAEALQQSGLLDESLSTITEALRYADKNEDLFQTAELHRQRGELFLALAPDHTTEAETCFQTSLAIARQQHSQAWRLRTTTSLARLWHLQGQTSRARQALAEIYDSYTVGFSTPDLLAAKSLLDELCE